MAQTHPKSSRQGVSESEFNMWRAVFAFSLVDNMLSLEEQKLLQTYLNTIPLSDQQLKILKGDFKDPQDVEALYRKITDPAHKERFCALARALVWCEGDMEKQEEIILRRLHCLSEGEGHDILRKSRNHPHLRTYYQSYAKAGMVGMMKSKPAFELRV